MSYPAQRLRRLRKTAVLRNLVAEHHLSVEDLISPVFVVPGKGVRKEVAALPGVHHLSVDRLIDEAKLLRDLGIPGMLVFGVPAAKHSDGRGAHATDGIVQKAVRAVKKAVPELAIVTDVCLCEYTDHGHCGIIQDGYLNNDASLRLLAKVAVSHAQA